MSGKKGRSGGPRANSGGARPNSGGKRPGAGRKPAQPPEGGPQPVDAALSAEAYLAGVVSGRFPADTARIAAARTLIRYEVEMRRGPIPAPAATRLHRSGQARAEREELADFERRAAEVLARYGKVK